jgi:hypothetical protein
MKIQMNLNRCIACKQILTESNITWEHIIPDFLGGKLQANFLCNRCNNNFGSKIIHTIKNDPAVRFAASALRKEIPEIFLRIEDRQEYVTENPLGTKIKAVRRGLHADIVSGKQNDDSLVLKTDDAASYLKKKLQIEDGYSEKEAEEKISSFLDLPNDELVKLSKRYKVIKWDMKGSRPNFSGKPLDEKAIVLIAYEYLALLIGRTVLGTKLDFIRNYINNNKNSARIIVEPFHASKYQPFHKIFPEFHDTETVIIIDFFSWIVYKVHFKKVKINTLDVVYLEDLRGKKSLISHSVKEAKEGKYYE